MTDSNLETTRPAAPAARVVREAISRLLQDLARQAERERQHVEQFARGRGSRLRLRNRGYTTIHFLDAAGIRAEPAVDGCLSSGQSDQERHPRVANADVHGDDRSKDSPLHFGLRIRGERLPDGSQICRAAGPTAAQSRHPFPKRLQVICRQKSQFEKRQDGQDAHRRAQNYSGSANQHDSNRPRSQSKNFRQTGGEKEQEQAGGKKVIRKQTVNRGLRREESQSRQQHRHKINPEHRRQHRENLGQHLGFRQPKDQSNNPAQ